MPWPIITPDHHEAAKRVLEAGRLVDGDEVRAFEREFAERVGASHAVMCQSGTAALHASLLALGVVRVAIPAFTFSGSALGALLSRIEIDWEDVDPATGAVREWRDEHDAAMVVHLHGNAAPVPDNVVIEDCCQAFGTLDESYRQVGYRGDTACWSLNATKTMWAGEGGVITCNDANLAADLRAIVRFGGSATQTWRDGYNWKPDEMRAALGRASLMHVDSWLAQAMANGALLDAALADSSTLRPLEFVGVPSRHKYRVRLADHIRLDQTLRFLRERGVPVARWQTTPLPHMEGFGGERIAPNADHLLQHSFVIGDEQNPLAGTSTNEVMRWVEALRDLY